MVCECAICALKIDFELDNHLLEEIESGRAVIFAGAGISTETSGAHSCTFYQEIGALLGGSAEESFCQLIDRFEDQPKWAAKTD